MRRKGSNQIRSLKETIAKSLLACLTANIDRPSCFKTKRSLLGAAIAAALSSWSGEAHGSRCADAEVERGLLGRRQREELPAEAQFRELLSVDHKSAFEIRFRMAQHGALFP